MVYRQKPVAILATTPVLASRQGEEAFPFVAAFKDLPDVFHEFRIELRVGKEIRSSTLMAHIVKIEEGPAETRVLIRLDPKVESALKIARNSRASDFAGTQVANLWIF